MKNKILWVIPLFLSSWAHAAVTSCEGITDEAARKRCDFVKESRESAKPTALPAPCAAIEDDRATNRRSTYLSDVSKCIRDYKNNMDVASNARLDNLVEKFADSTFQGLKPGDAFGSCNYMAKNGMVATVACADLQKLELDASDIQKTTATQEAMIPTGDGKKPGVFTLHPNAYWAFPFIYMVYHGSAETNGVVQNVSFYDDPLSTKSYQMGMSFMDAPHPNLTDKDLGAYAITSMVKAPNGIDKKDYPQDTSEINAENEYPTETGKIVMTLEDVGVSMRGDGSGSIATEEEFIDPVTGKKTKKKTALVNNSPVSYGFFGFQLAYKNIAPEIILGTSTVRDSGTVPFGTCPKDPGPPPPSSPGYDSDYPVGSTGAGAYGATGGAPSVKTQCVNIYHYHWWWTQVCGKHGCRWVYHVTKTPHHTAFTRSTTWPYFVTPHSKEVNVNIVNTY